MSKRLSLSNPAYEKELIALMREKTSATNERQVTILKKALADVIKNDLTTRQKQMIVLYYYEGMKMKEIAAMLEVDPTTVSRTLSRAMHNIFIRLQYLL